MDASLISHMIYSLDVKDRETNLNHIKDALPKNFIMEYDDISDDLFFNNPILRCFDDLQKK
jgi:hypothetical protein